MTTLNDELITRKEIAITSKRLDRFYETVRLCTATLPSGDHYFKELESGDGPHVMFLDKQGPHWLYVGVRHPGLTHQDENTLGWDVPGLARTLALYHAQTHYLALYERVDHRNKFQCRWHY